MEGQRRNDKSDKKQSNETNNVDRHSEHNHTQDCNLGMDEDNQGMSKPTEQVGSYSN